MGRKFSMPEYYHLQGMLAEKYGIEDFHSGCHVTHYGVSDLCTVCVRSDKCAEIYNAEKNTYNYLAGKIVAKEKRV